MTFSESVKEELIHTDEPAECCALAELSALIHTAGSIVLHGGRRYVEIYTKTAIEERLNGILGRLYGARVDCGDNIYIIDAEISQSVLTDCGILGYDELNNIYLIEGIDKYIVEDGCCARAYVRGAFLGAGSISGVGGGSSLHLEISSGGELLAKGLKELLAKAEIPSGIIGRRGKNVLYVKGGEHISDMLAYIGAPRAVTALNNELVSRDVNNRINRRVNCDNANLYKSIDAAARQIEAITRLCDRGKLGALPEELRELAQYRLNSPDATYEQIAADTGLKKSTVSYRLKRITEIANKITL